MSTYLIVVFESRSIEFVVVFFVSYTPDPNIPEEKTSVFD